MGHQAIGAAFGGKINGPGSYFTGRPVQIHHDGKGVFRKLADPLPLRGITRLIVERKTLPRELMITAETDDGIIMGLRHRRYKIEGVQFHPESVFDKVGEGVVEEFLGVVRVGRIWPESMWVGEVSEADPSPAEKARVRDEFGFWWVVGLLLDQF